MAIDEIAESYLRAGDFEAPNRRHFLLTEYQVSTRSVGRSANSLLCSSIAIMIGEYFVFGIVDKIYVVRLNCLNL